MKTRWQSAVFASMSTWHGGDRQHEMLSRVIRRMLRHARKTRRDVLIWWAIECTRRVARRMRTEIPGLTEADLAHLQRVESWDGDEVELGAIRRGEGVDVRVANAANDAFMMLLNPDAYTSADAGAALTLTAATEERLTGPQKLAAVESLMLRLAERMDGVQ